MSDTFTGDDDQQDDGVRDPNIRKAISDANQRASAAEGRAAELEREMAFTKATVPDNPLGSVFRKGYDGDVTPEAIKAAWEEIAPPPAGDRPAQDDGVDAQLQAELDAQRRLAGVGQAGDAGTGEVTFEDAIRSAKSESEVLALVRQAPADATDDQGRRIAPVEVT